MQVGSGQHEDRAKAPRVYVAGPQAVADERQRWDGIRLALRVGDLVSAAGAHPVFSYLTSVYLPRQGGDCDAWLDATRRQLLSCHGSVVVPDWNPRSRLMDEVAICQHIEIPAYFVEATKRVFCLPAEFYDWVAGYRQGYDNSTQVRREAAG